MSLTIHEFNHLVIVRKSQETQNCLISPELRESDRKEISAQVEHFLKKGGKITEITPTKNVSCHMHIGTSAQPDNHFLRNAVKNLRTSFGNNLDIQICPETGKYKAIYKGGQIGALKKSLSTAEAAIRCQGLKDKNKIT